MSTIWTSVLHDGGKDVLVAEAVMASSSAFDSSDCPDAVVVSEFPIGSESWRFCLAMHALPFGDTPIIVSLNSLLIWRVRSVALFFNCWIPSNYRRMR